MSPEEVEIIEVVVSTMEDRLVMIKSHAALQELQRRLFILTEKRNDQLDHFTKGRK